MSGEQKTRLVAYGFIAVSAITITLVMMKSGVSQIPTRAIRFTLTCVLAIMLIKRADWARWLTGILCAITAVMALSRLASPSAFQSVMGIWGTIMALFYAWAAYTLLLDSDVARHFHAGKPVR